MIILTAAQANNVRGLTMSGHALAPKPFVLSGASAPGLNGRFALSEAVINDAAHAIHQQFLLSLPSLPDNIIHNGTPPPDSPPGTPLTDCDWEQDPTRCALYAYESTWLPGQIIVINE
jgi:hypothetical protein